jgi:predicted transcriptional regulator of viral defense system
MAGQIRKQLWEVALDQHGYVTSGNAAALDINVVELGKLSSRGQLQKIAYGIYRFEQLPQTGFEMYMLATLWTGGVLSHDTALELWQLCEINPTKIHVTVTGRPRRHKEGGEAYVVHPGHLTSDETAYYERIPIVRPNIAIAQGIRSGVQSHLLVEAIETAKKRGLITAHDLDGHYEQLKDRR